VGGWVLLEGSGGGVGEGGGWCLHCGSASERRFLIARRSPGTASQTLAMVFTGRVYLLTLFAQPSPPSDAHPTCPPPTTLQPSTCPACMHAHTTISSPSCRRWRASRPMAWWMSSAWCTRCECAGWLAGWLVLLFWGGQGVGSAACWLAVGRPHYVPLLRQSGRPTRPLRPQPHPTHPPPATRAQCKVNAPARITRKDGTDTDKRSVMIKDDSGASIEVGGWGWGLGGGGGGGVRRGVRLDHDCSRLSSPHSQASDSLLHLYAPASSKPRPNRNPHPLQPTPTHPPDSLQLTLWDKHVTSPGHELEEALGVQVGGGGVGMGGWWWGLLKGVGNDDDGRSGLLLLFCRATRSS